MLTYIFKRVLYAIPIALSVTVVSFILVYLAPGDPLNAIAPADAPAEVIQALKSAYGLDRPVPVQYGMWLLRAVQGDLGTSIASGRAVAGEVLSAVGNTLLLAGFAAFAGVLAGCILGALAGYHRGSWIDRAATAVSVIGVNLSYLVGGSIIVEKVFALPGLGSLMVQAIFARDFPTIQGVTLFVGLLVVLVGVLTDVVYALLDPRVSFGKERR